MRAIHTVVALALLVILGPRTAAARGVDFQAPSSRQPTPSTNVLVVRDRTEPALAINPRNPSNLAGESNPSYNINYPVGQPTTEFASFDGGKTWSTQDLPLKSPYIDTADPSVAFDSHGTAYFLYLGESPAYCTAGASAVVLVRSTDGGRHLSAPLIVDAGGSHDKPWLAVQSFPNRPDHVFVVWSRFIDHGMQLFVQRSLDGGRHFSRPTLLTQSSWFNFGAMPVVGPRGRVTVVWATFVEKGGQPIPEQILARTSRDDGSHWEPAVSVSHGAFAGMPNLVVPGDLRVFDLPSIAVTRSGALYVAWTAVRVHQSWGGVLSNVLLARSTDGTHWSAPVRVNDSLSGDRFMPTVSALPDGSAGIAFYDRRTNHTDFNVYAARVVSTKGKLVAGPNVRLNAGPGPEDNIYEVPSGACVLHGRFFGDYLSSAADAHGTFHVIWGDTQRLANGQTDIWTASFRWR